jgi:hypothetical protein
MEYTKTTVHFPIGNLSKNGQKLVLKRVQEEHPDAESTLTPPFKISVTPRDMVEACDGLYYLGVSIGRLIGEQTIRERVG